ncbi:MAG TPA: sugar ABC transporter permease [Clostridia bacterium]
MNTKGKCIYPWFILPSAIIVIIYLIPICNIFYSAFTKSVGSEKVFVGFDNFTRVAPELPKLIWKTLIWTMGSIIPATVLGLTAALLFQKDTAGKKLMITACILPYTIPLVIVATAWTLMYQPNFGLLNIAMVKLGIIEKPISFLSYDNAMGSVIVARIWRAMPFAFISYYAAIRSIPAELYEAAEVDGAKPVHKLLYVTLPQLVSITSTTLIILTVWTFLVFDIIFTMTGGGPADATNIIAVQIYKKSIYMNDSGGAAVLSLVAIIILFFITLLYWRLFNKGGETE